MSQPWIPHPIALEGKIVSLRPLEEDLLDALHKAASDPRIWEFYTGDWSQIEKFRKVYLGSLKFRDRGIEYPFVIYHKTDHRIIGSTRLMDIAQYDHRLEIGGTWLMPQYWATAVNFDCKLELLRYSFETLNANRVQLKTQHDNLRSRKAIEKIGGRYEGILRQHILKDDGSYRSSAYYSILKDEWPQVKELIQEQLSTKL